MTSPKVLNEHYCKKLSFSIYRLVFQTFLSVILEPSCKVIKEMLFRIVLSSVDHLPSRSAYIFLWKSLDVCSFSAMYSHPVSSMHLDISPSGLLILFLPALFSVSVGSILRFCRLIYSVSLLFNPFPCMEMPLLSCISKSIIHPSFFHFPHILSVLLTPSVATRHFFSCPAIHIPLCPSIQLPPLFSPATHRH